MDTPTRVLSRTWAATVTYRECGVTVERVTYAVTLTCTAQGIEATIDGQHTDLRGALNILHGAQVEVTAETLATAPIRKPRATRLHRFMAYQRWRLAVGG